jgi:hypothetical protein
MTPHIGKREEKVEFGLTLRRIVLLGTPLVLTILMIFHPSPYDNVAGELMPIAGWWITLHSGLAGHRCHRQSGGSGGLCGVLRRRGRHSGHINRHPRP